MDLYNFYDIINFTIFYYELIFFNFSIMNILFLIKKNKSKIVKKNK